MDGGYRLRGAIGEMIPARWYHRRMHSPRIAASALALAFVLAIACAPDGKKPAGGGDASVSYDLAPTGARITGTVFGPGGKFPISGALVAAIGSNPDPIPSQTYCSRCVELPPGAAFARSGADGRFTLDLPLNTGFSLLVQKGEFRRVRPYITPGTPGVYELEAQRTTLPSHTDEANGDTIPRIALVYGDSDSLQDVLGKVGLGRVDGTNTFAWGSEKGAFDVFDNSGPVNKEKHGEPLANLLFNQARLLTYHVIFFACSYNANFSFMTDPRAQTNLREFVRKGGKLYVSDYAYAVVELPWPKFINWSKSLYGTCTENKFPDGCNHGPPFTAPSRSPDADLSAWLLAVDKTAKPSMALPGRAEFETNENWDTIATLDTDQVGNDVDNGMAVSLAPKVWVEGTWNYKMADVPPNWDYSTHHPFTVGFPYGCGRVLYTTYHTVGGTNGGQHPGFLTQELVLWYLILELQTCQDLRIQ